MIDTKMNNTLRMLLAIVAIGSTGLAVSAQAVGTAPTVNLRLESARTKKRLAEIVAKIQKNQHDDAVAELQAILDEASGDLIEIDGSPTLVPARTVARTLLVSLPPAVRERLRERMESVARTEIAEARKRNDLPALQRLIDR
jgi:hypothetical protein